MMAAPFSGAKIPASDPGRVFRRRHVAAAAVSLIFVAMAAGGWFAGGEDGSSPIPLAEPNLATAAGLLVQAVVVAFMLIFPGLAIVSWLTGGKAPAWPGALIFGVACLLSCLSVTMLTLFSVRLFGPQVARYLVAGGCLAAAAASRPMLKQLILRWRRAASRLDLAVVGGGFLLYLLLAALMSATPYPALVPDAVDVPEFARMAANFARTGHLAEDYIIYCTATGKLDYAASLAIVPTVLTAASHLLLWVNPHSFFLIHLFFGMAMLGVAASVATHGIRGPKGLAGVAFVLLAAVPFLFKPVALGSAGTLLGLAGVVLISLWQQHESNVLRQTCFVIICASLIVMRPEGAILAVVFAATALVVWLSVIKSTILRTLTGAGIAFAVLAAFCAVIDHSGLVARNPNVRFVDYDAQSMRFRKTFDTFDYYQDVIRTRLKGEPARVTPNTILGRQILEHPLAFARFAAERLRPIVASMAIWISDGSSAVWMTVIILLTLLAAARRDQLAGVLVVLAFLAALGLVQDRACVRHWLGSLIVILALAVRSVALPLATRATAVFSSTAFARGWGIARPGIVLPAVLLALWAGVVLHLAQRTYWLRLSSVNQHYVEPLRRLASLAPAGALTACSYPPLATCLTGQRCVGGMWFAENLDEIAARYRPDWILMDDGKMDSGFTGFSLRGRPLRGYSVVLIDQANRYLILRKQEDLTASAMIDDAAP